MEKTIFVSVYLSYFYKRLVLGKGFVQVVIEWWHHKGYSLVMKLINSDTHSCTHSLASLAIYKQNGDIENKQNYIWENTKRILKLFIHSIIEVSGKWSKEKGTCKYYDGRLQ